ncbi:hypothetical protein [Aquimarina macrocephali]|uniref:hypothetical protein n=1 Tax=Aquimarina macrocephali TaxID=666563 RepID=UPI003F67DE35
MKKIIIFISLVVSILSCEEIEVDTQKANPTDFSITASVNQESLLVNEKFEFNLFIEAVTPITEELNYSLKFFDTGVNGKLSINGIVYQEGESIPGISQGTTVIDYIGNEVGSGNITFQVIASNDLVKSIPVSISIQKTDFDFEVLFDQSENYINEKTSFNINLKKRGSESLTFKAYFKNIEGEVTLDNQGESILQNRMFDIAEGVTFGNFRGIVPEESEIEFVVEASNGITKSQSVSYKTLLTNFTVLVTPTPLRDGYLSGIDFGILILPPENLTQELNYSLFFTSEGLGDLRLTIRNFGDDTITSSGYEVGLDTPVSYSLNGFLQEMGVGSARQGNMTLYFKDSNGATYETTVDVEFLD